METKLKAARANEYERVGAITTQALPVRSCLNARACIGVGKYTECITYAKKVIASSHRLNNTGANGSGTAYDELFLVDNSKNGTQNEFTLLASFDGLNAKTYGGTTFTMHGATGGSMNATALGLNSSWGDIIVTKELVNKFETSTRNDNNESTV